MAKKGSTDNSWISFSDIMTGLMVIFLFISISYMFEVRKTTDRINDIVDDYIGTKVSLFNELDSVFKDDFRKWQVELDEDLSIKFTNPEVLFPSGQATIQPYFKEILDTFIPRYFDILLQKKYDKKIAEIRIEGHTDTEPARRYDNDDPSYIGNIKLSQERSAEVMKYFRSMPYYKNLPNTDEQKLQFLLTANGLSYGRTLDDNGQLTNESGRLPNNELSRRVEFRIITTSEIFVEQVTKELKEKSKK